MNVLDRISVHIKAHAEGIAEIISTGKVAVVVFEPSQQAKEILRQAYAWNGEPFFRLSTKQRKALARSLDNGYGDKVASRWLTDGRDGRILVFTQNGSLCVNFTPGKGYEIEPGTLDTERAKAMH